MISCDSAKNVIVGGVRSHRAEQEADSKHDICRRKVCSPCSATDNSRVFKLVRQDCLCSKSRFERPVIFGTLLLGVKRKVLGYLEIELGQMAAGKVVKDFRCKGPNAVRFLSRIVSRYALWQILF